MKLHPDWLVPDWPAPDNVRAVFTTRAGGVSRAPFDSFNLGRPSDDDAAAVDVNRARLRAALDAEPVYLSQVHGTHSVELTQPVAAGLLHADACATAVPRLACTIRVADCLPMLLTNRRGDAVAGAHAGWRGLSGGVLEASYRHFAGLCQRVAPGQPAHDVAQQTIAWLGPWIGPDAFEVGPEVRAEFLRRDPDHAAACFVARPGGKWLADLPALARLRLHALGVTQIYGNDGAPQWCTAGNPSRFFSHRRDNVVLGGSGRMAACIWRLG